MPALWGGQRQLANCIKNRSTEDLTKARFVYAIFDKKRRVFRAAVEVDVKQGGKEGYCEGKARREVPDDCRDVMASLKKHLRSEGILLKPA